MVSPQEAVAAAMDRLRATFDGTRLRDALSSVGQGVRDAAGNVTGASPPALGLNSADLLLAFALLLGGLLALTILLRPHGPRAPRAASMLPPLLGALVGALWGVLTYTVGYVAIILSSPIPRLQGLGLEGAIAHVLSGVTYWELTLAAAGAVCGALFARYRWRALGLLSYVGLVILISGYVLYAVTTALPAVPPDQRWVSYVLLVAETGSLGLVLIFAFYSLDVSSRRHWMRLPERLPRSRRYVPKVAVQVPVYNEPMDVITITVARLCAQDYPKDRFIIMVIDDSSDQKAKDELAAFCRRVGARYMTRPDRRGFKAGALNYALRRSPRDVEIIGVVDADYWVEPDYLRSVVGYFVAPRLGFLQTPQDYRNIDESYLTRQYYNAEAYFYHAVLPSRNEENAIIFCGTMGLIRRRALEQAGGWGEEHVCEDAELSVRLAALGWDSLYVSRSFGKGLMPAVFDAYKKQFHRWSYGNVRILLAHFGGIMASRMTRRQKFDFVAGNLHWFDGVFICAIAASLLAVAWGEVLGYRVVTHHQRELLLLALVPIFLLVDGAVRVHIVLRRAGRFGFRNTLRVLGMWFAIKFTNMQAALKSLAGVKAPFVRTPKNPGGALPPRQAAMRSLALARGESITAAVLWVSSLLVLSRFVVGPAHARVEGTLLLAFWLLLYGLMFACAPIYAYLSYRTLRPGAIQSPLTPTLRSGPSGASGTVLAATPATATVVRNTTNLTVREPAFVEVQALPTTQGAQAGQPSAPASSSSTVLTTTREHHP